LSRRDRGWLILTQFVHAPFPHHSRSNGHIYKEVHYPAREHYSDGTVALFVPKHFQPSSRVDFVIHFHGWNNNVSNALQQFQMADLFLAGRRNAILLVPEGPKNAPDSSGGKLEDTGGFVAFMSETMAVLKRDAVLKADSQVGGVILSGHSGGYRVISAIVDRGGMTNVIREVWLFDALYAQADKFLAWADREQGRLLNIYTDNGGTRDDSEAMMETLRKRGTPFLAAEDTAISPDQLRTNWFVFLRSRLSHSGVFAERGTFREFLETSRLQPVPDKRAD
jgi:hypothetical protein